MASIREYLANRIKEQKQMSQTIQEGQATIAEMETQLETATEKSDAFDYLTGRTIEES